MEGDIDLREFGVEGKIVHCMLYKFFKKNINNILKIEMVLKAMCVESQNELTFVLLSCD